MTVTHLIQENKFDELRGLIAKRELSRLRTEIETEWSDVQRNTMVNIYSYTIHTHAFIESRFQGLNEEEIVEATVNRVVQQRIAYLKFCDIDLTFIASRELDSESNPNLLQINTRYDHGN